MASFSTSVNAGSSSRGVLPYVEETVIDPDLTAQEGTIFALAASAVSSVQTLSGRVRVSVSLTTGASTTGTGNSAVFGGVAYTYGPNESADPADPDVATDGPIHGYIPAGTTRILNISGEGKFKFQAHLAALTVVVTPE